MSRVQSLGAAEADDAASIDAARAAPASNRVFIGSILLQLQVRGDFPRLQTSGDLGSARASCCLHAGAAQVRSPVLSRRGRERAGPFALTRRRVSSARKCGLWRLGQIDRSGRDLRSASQNPSGRHRGHACPQARTDPLLQRALIRRARSNATTTATSTLPQLEPPSLGFITNRPSFVNRSLTINYSGARPVFGHLPGRT